MGTIETLNRFATHWFDSIVAQSLYAAIAAGLVWAVLQLWKPKHPVWAVALWALVLIRFVMPVNLAAPWTARTFVERSSQNWIMRDFSQNQKTQRSLLPSETAAVELISPSNADPVYPEKSISWTLIVFGLWLAGVSLLVARLIRAYRNLTHIVTCATSAVPEPLLNSAEQWRATLGVRRPVTLMSSSDVNGAFTCYVFKPVIVLPDALIQRLSQADLSAIIGHEMAHIRGLDSAWLLLEQVLRALFFFHPAIWFATSRLDAAREALRDLDMLNAGQVTANTYAGTLLSVLKNHIDAVPAPLLGVAMGRTAERLKQRLLLLRASAALKSPSRWLLAGSTLAVAAIILPMAHSAATKAKQDVARAKPDPILLPDAKPALDPQSSIQIPAVNGVADVYYRNDVPAPDAPVPPAPPTPPATWLQQDAEGALADVAESEREAQQAIIEAEQAVREAEIDATTATQESRQALAEAQLSARQARHDAGLAARAATEARRSLQFDTARNAGSLDTMVVIDGNQIRCGSMVHVGKEHQIIVNDKNAACTGTLTQADVEGKTRHTAGAVAILGKRGTVRVGRNGKDVYIYSDSGNHQTYAHNSYVQPPALSSAEIQEIARDARRDALESLNDTSASLREQRASLRESLKHSGLPQQQIDQMIKSIDQSLANIEQHRATLSRNISK
jgi:beta-lactamase regulating signal transducer with metallopeptidase domain